MEIIFLNQHESLDSKANIFYPKTITALLSLRMCSDRSLGFSSDCQAKVLCHDIIL